jgi:hypothetical protein
MPMRFVFGQLKEVVTVAGEKYAITVMCELKNGFVGGIFRQYLPQEPNFMCKFFEQIAQVVRHIVVE